MGTRILAKDIDKAQGEPKIKKCVFSERSGTEIKEEDKGKNTRKQKMIKQCYTEG